MWLINSEFGGKEATQKNASRAGERPADLVN
jgi:hypothetical protein